MKEDSIGTEPLIELDPRELLGLSQVAKVSGEHAATGRLLIKSVAKDPQGAHRDSPRCWARSAKKGRS
jgi:hypothetical protein